LEDSQGVKEVLMEGPKCHAHIAVQSQKTKPPITPVYRQ
jgi:hypothetical protein